METSRSLWSAVAVSLALFASAAQGAGAEPLRALILSGQNNHAWKETTPVLRAILERSGRFTVDVTETPQEMSAESLAGVDVIVSNWNAWDDPPVKEWPEAVRAALLDRIRKGGGYVSVHAGSSSFYDWDEYQEMAMAAWKLGETGHGKQHVFRVTPAAVEHPITAGVEPFDTFDELWHRVPLRGGAQVLATAFSSAEGGGTGADEPVLMVRDYGTGRSANLLLGHNVRAMTHPSFGLLLARAAEWAATGNVTISAPVVEWTRDADHLALKVNGAVWWRVNFGPSLRKPYFDPVTLGGGPNLTWEAPPDHAWHHGLWFSWKFINGLNYWEEDPKTGRSEGATLWDPPEIETRPDGSAVIKLQLRYEPEPGKPVLRESRLMEVSRPGADGSYRIDWTSTFEALAPEVVLDRTPIAGEPNGVSWGGYAGLSVRFAPMSEAKATTESADLSFTDGTAAADAEGVDYSGVVEGQTCGIAILQRPGNPLSPTPWYLIANPGVPFHYFSPAVLYRAPRSLKQGETLKLSYRISIHSDRWPAERVRRQLEQLAGE